MVWRWGRKCIFHPIPNAIVSDYVYFITIFFKMPIYNYKL